MKKMISFTIVALLLACGSVFADGQYNAGNNGSLVLGTAGDATKASVTVKPSANVYTYYAAGGTDGIAYVLATSHNKGTRSFGTSSGDSKIFYVDTTLNDPPDAPSTADGTVDYEGSGWRAL